MISEVLPRKGEMLGLFTPKSLQLWVTRGDCK